MKTLYTCLMYGEGSRDKNFLMALIDLQKFRYHTSKWFIHTNSASGSSPEVILSQCQADPYFSTYNLVLCFIDTDILKSQYSDSWESEREKLEKSYLQITIIWQNDSAEDEYRKVVGEECYNKHKLNKLAREKVEMFINSDFWKRILKPIQDKERELEK